MRRFLYQFIVTAPSDVANRFSTINESEIDVAYSWRGGSFAFFEWRLKWSKEGKISVLFEQQNAVVVVVEFPLRTS